MTAEAQVAITSAKHAQLTTRTAALSVAVAGVLIALKTWAVLASGSAAMMASLADSTLDAFASLITFFAVRYAAAPPDREHRFGHGKAEAFAGLMQAGLVAAASVLITVEAAHRLISPPPLAHGVEALIVMFISIGLTAALIYVQSRALSRTGSIATRADRLHYAGDLAANLIVVVGLVAGVTFKLYWADGVAALLVGGYLAWGAVHVAREAADHLLDRELPDGARAEIQALAEADGAIRGVHDLRTRASGPYLHVQFHADLDPTLTLEEAHKIVVAAEDRIRGAFPTADIIIHPDPKGRAAPHGHEDFERRAS